jgi:hypothetical protein
MQENDGDKGEHDTDQGPSTPSRKYSVSHNNAALLTTSGSASLASASSIPPPLLSRSSIKSLATLSEDQKTTPSLHIHLDESSHQIRLSPSPSRPRSVLSTATDEGLEGSLVLDSAQRAEEERSKGANPESADRTLFLARRLRSAIGDELVLKDANLTAKAGSNLNTSEPSISKVAVSGVPSNAVSKTASDQSGPSDSSGWGWSNLTTLPNSLRIGGQKTMASLSTDTAINAKPKVDQKPDAGSSSSSIEGPTFASYMKPLDVRNWWPSSSSSSIASGERPESVRSLRNGKDDSSTKSTESSKASPNKARPLQGVPSGSFPASSIAKRNKKKREQLLKQAKGNEKASEDGDDSTTKGVTVAEGSDIIAHDLSDQQFGAMDESGRSYAEREYLVLSTAGKPIFISHVSKARLKRAAETKARRQQRQQEGGTDAKDEEEERLLAAEDSALQDEEDQNAATRVGVIQALISNYESLGLKELQHKSKEILELPKNSRISFLLKPPLYLAATSQWGEDEITLCNHLEYLYYAIISIVSASKLNRLFDRAANFDLKRLLDGTDGILDCLLTGLQVEAAPLYDSLRPLRIEAALRAETAAALVPSKDTVRPQDALYALLVGPSGVVALAKRKRKSIHPVDCHLLINTVYATKSMKEAGTQSWVPICLPKFAPQGFLYAHVSFLREREDQRNAEGADKEGALNENGQQTGKFTSELALVLVTSNPDGFDELSIWQNSIEETLYTQGILRRLKKAMLISNATYTVGELRLPGLRHFIFKWRSNLQSTSPQFEDPYEMNSDDQKRLICLYGIAQEYVYRRATSSSAIIPPPENAEQKPKDEEQKQEQQQKDSDKVLVASPPSPIIRPKNILAPSLIPESKAKTKKINAPVLPLAPKRKPIITGQHLLKTSSEIVFAWSTSQFELYLAVGLHLPRNAIINIAKAIVKWVKQEEHRLFIASPSIFD